MKKRGPQGPNNRVYNTTDYRKCLRCDQLFKSSGPGNRICSTCHCVVDVQYVPHICRDTSDHGIKPGPTT